jgi:nicotinate-nucleotide pyrophosphorylase (carboxylating)
MTPLEKEDYISLIKTALAEDVGPGDITTGALGLGGRRARAVVKTKEDGVIAGLHVAADVFLELDPDAKIEFLAKDGDLLRMGTPIMQVDGLASALLTAERTALNFLQRLSGIATFTYQMAKQVQNTRARIYDTRKTTPGMRLLEKYAVRAGGGCNHRIGLFDAVLLKDNHVLLAGGVGSAVRLAKQKLGPGAFVEVEVESLEETQEAIDAGADLIMLDNMSLVQMDEAVSLIAGRAEIEVSGNVSMLTVGRIADIGVDVISVGALTHSADSLDISMDFLPED